jgi:hypothetical protein
MTGLHGRQHRAHWIVRLYDHFTPAVGDAVVIAVAVGAVGFIAWLWGTGA